MVPIVPALGVVATFTRQWFKLLNLCSSICLPPTQGQEIIWVTGKCGKTNALACRPEASAIFNVTLRLAQRQTLETFHALFAILRPNPP